MYIRYLFIVLILFLFSCSKKTPDSGGVVLPNSVKYSVNLHGKVLKENSRPFVSVEVKLAGTNLSTQTDDSGRYSFIKEYDEQFLDSIKGRDVYVKVVENSSVLASVKVDSLIGTVDDIIIVQRDVYGKIVGDLSAVDKIEATLISSTDTSFIELGLNNLVKEFSGFVYINQNHNENNLYKIFIRIYNKDSATIAKSDTIVFDEKLGDIRFPDIYIGNVLFELNFDVNSKINQGDSVLIVCNISDTMDNKVVYYKWKMDDNFILEEWVDTNFSQITLPYVFLIEGEHKITLSILDKYKNSVTKSINVDVVNYSSIIINSNYNRDISTGDTVLFDYNIYDKQGVKEIIVDFGDNSFDTIKTSKKIIDTLSNPYRELFNFNFTHKYNVVVDSDSIVKKIKVIVVDKSDNTTTFFNDSVIIHRDIPIGNIKIFNNINPKIGDTIYFDASSSVDRYGEIVDYKWSFSNNPLKYFYGKKIYVIYDESYKNQKVTLQITNNSGNSSTINEYILQSGIFVDSRDNQKYRWVKIGNQTWMAQNLNYIPPYYEEGKTDGVYIGKYKYSPTYQYSSDNYGEVTNGILYSWTVAMNLPQKYEIVELDTNYEYYQGIAPEGWHLPTKEEWQELMDYVQNNYIKQHSLDTLQYNIYLSKNIGGTDLFGFNAYLFEYNISFSSNYRSRFFVAGKQNQEYCSCLFLTRDEMRFINVENWSGFSIRCIKNKY